MATRRFMEIIARGESGDPMTEKEFDMLVFKTAKKMVKKHGVKFDPENLVCTDEDLIDRTFEASMDLLTTLGIFNCDSGRTIEISRADIKETLRATNPVAELGVGKDKIYMHHRDIEDPRLPVIIGGCGNAVDEEIRYKIYSLYASNPYIDYIEPLPPYKYRGMLVKAGSPFELTACLDNISLWRKACRDMGRPGAPIKGKDGVSAIADVSTNRDDCGYRTSDHSNVYFKTLLKTNYENLNRAVQYSQYGMYVSNTGNGYVGGYAGGIEGAVICSVAEQVASMMVFNASIGGSCVMESLYPNQTSRQALWGTNIASAAMNKHTKMPGAWASYMTTAGPCTKMCLYEIAVATIGTTVMGNHCFGVAPNQGVTPNYVTPMESQMMGEVAYAATKLTRVQANELVLKLVPKYEEVLLKQEAPKGKTFQELYDLDTLQPCQEYVDLYNEVWAELEEMGLKR